MATSGFDYELAFSRNIGWLTPAEQARLRASRVAIAGLGGVGGSHLLALARLGVENFSLADFDTFGVENFNRQAGAMMSTVGHPKLDCLARMVRDINPDCDLRLFPEGVTNENLSSFLEDADLYLDSLDFFALDIRRAVFQYCARSGIPAVTAAPLGMSGAVLTFLPGHVSFEEYFRLEGCNPAEAQLRFLLGLAPRMLHRSYLVDPSSVDLEAKRGPSTTIACHLCTGLAVAESTKLLIGRGPVLAAPRGFQVDGYRNRIVRTWRPWGNANPLQRIALWIARHQLQRFKEQKSTNATPPDRGGRTSSQSPIEQVLDFARWAPSGDNAQPWRFEIRDENAATVHGFDTRETVVYDLDGRASQLALGALMETIRLGASRLGAKAEVTVREPLDEMRPLIDIALVRDSVVKPDPLCDAVLSRSVARGLMSMKHLTRAQQITLEESLPEGFRLLWFLGLKAKAQVANLLFTNGGLRLALPEGFTVHRDVIEWGPAFSKDRIPAAALGMSTLSALMTRWTLGDWRRMAMVNRIPGATILPRLELDWLPAMLCGAHVAIVAAQEPVSLRDYLDAGASVQRFWLRAETLGLLHQPAMTPLIFARYAREGRQFSRRADAQARAQHVHDVLSELFGGEAVLRRVVWFGRLGSLGGRQDSSVRPRSTRLSLDELRWPDTR